MQIPNSVLPANRAGHAAASPQLVKAANEFEANFLGELLKPMREDPLFGDGSGLGGDSLASDGPGGAMGTIGNLASEAFAQAIAKRGGFGIAKLALAELAPVEAARSQQGADLLAGPECGGCAAPPALGAETESALEAGSVEMLGQGNLPVLQLNPLEKDGAIKPERGAIVRESGSHLQAAGPVRAVTGAR